MLWNRHDRLYFHWATEDDYDGCLFEIAVFQMKTFNWTKEEPPRFWWGDFVEINVSPMPSHVRKFFEDGDVIEDWTYLSVKGDGLDLLEKEVNGHSVDWHGKTLAEFLQTFLSNHERWVVVFEWHCDQIDSVYSLSVGDCVAQLQSNLSWDVKREGFVVLSRRQSRSASG